MTLVPAHISCIDLSNNSIDACFMIHTEICKLMTFVSAHNSYKDLKLIHTSVKVKLMHAHDSYINLSNNEMAACS